MFCGSIGLHLIGSWHSLLQGRLQPFRVDAPVVSLWNNVPFSTVYASRLSHCSRLCWKRAQRCCPYFGWLVWSLCKMWRLYWRNDGRATLKASREGTVRSTGLVKKLLKTYTYRVPSLLPVIKHSYQCTACGNLELETNIFPLEKGFSTQRKEKSVDCGSRPIRMWAVWHFLYILKGVSLAQSVDVDVYFEPKSEAPPRNLPIVW